MEAELEQDSGGDDGGGGAPGWMATFADLMSLLLAFFVLLFSFASVDDKVYKEVGGSLSEAFGVQRREYVMDKVLGINHIAQEYSSGRPDPNILNIVPQEHLHVDKPNEVPMEMSENEVEKKDSRAEKDYKGDDQSDIVSNVTKAKKEEEYKRPVKLKNSVSEKKDQSESQAQAQALAKQMAEEKQDEQSVALMGKALATSKGDALGAAEKSAKNIANKNIAKEDAKDVAKGGKQELLKRAMTALAEQRVAEVRRRSLETTATFKAKKLGEQMAQEIANGKLSIETEGNKVIIRISEEASFAPGSVEALGPFTEIVNKIGKAIKDQPGTVTVAGHTDNMPLTGGAYRSNWELSAARAISVVDGLVRGSNIPRNTLKVEAFADTKPIATNVTPEGRSKNRRVEVILEYDKLDLVPPDMKDDILNLSDFEEEEEEAAPVVEEEVEQEPLTGFEESLLELTGPESTSEKYDLIFKDDFFQ